MGPATVPVSEPRPPEKPQDGHRWPLRTSPAVYLQQNSGQSQRIGTRGAPSVPLKERADLQPG